MALTYIAEQRNQWTDYKIRQAKALADYNAIVYVDPPGLTPLDPVAVARIATLKAEIEAVKLDHTGMTRHQYRQALSDRRAEVQTLKAVLAPVEAANDLLTDAAKTTYKTALRQAKRAYLNIWDEERAYFGFVTGTPELVADA
jgi:hypothetical protein